MQIPDSLIFDMDGTLWDNVHTYAIAWNNAITLRGYGDEVTVTRDDLLKYMGKEISQIVKGVFPDKSAGELEALFREVERQYHLLVPTMQPYVFEGVREGLEKLARNYPLFLLSNCEKDGLVHFMNNTGTRHLFRDYMEHGMNLKPKHHNLQLLKERHGLQSPMYVGDTDGDSRQSRIAGVPFVFVTYGFGKTDDYALKFDSFPQLTEYFLG